MALDLIKKGDFYIEPIDDLQNGKLSPEKVREILTKDKIVSNDKFRKPINGVFFDEKGRAVATDGHIMIVYKFSKNDGRFNNLKGKIIDKEGNEIEEKFPNYSLLFPDDPKLCFEIKLDKRLISFLYRLDKKTTSYRDIFFVKYENIKYGYRPKYIYCLFKALYDLGETNLLVYPFNSGYTIFLGKNTKSIIAPIVANDYDFLKGGVFCEMSDYDDEKYYSTDNFEQFLSDYREGKINIDEVNKPITGNFATMLKMFEENGIQTEFVDTNEKIIERLKKEGHSDENINFSLQEDFELDDEDDEPKQGTLDLSFLNEESRVQNADLVYKPVLKFFEGQVKCCDEILHEIQNSGSVEEAIGIIKGLRVSMQRRLDEEQTSYQNKINEIKM